MNRIQTEWIAGMVVRILPIVLLVIVASTVAAGACCCTCENSLDCFPICVGELSDAASCNAACQQAQCGSVAPCPDPASGEGCSPGAVSCFDIGPSGVPVPAPAVSTSGLLVAVLLLAGVGAVGLAQRRIRLR